MSNEGRISQREAADLRRVVNGRFELLDREIETRKKEVEAVVRKMVKEQHAGRIRDFVKRGEKLAKRAEALRDEGVRLGEEAEAAGFSMSTSDYHDRIVEVHRPTFAPAGLQRAINEALKQVELQGDMASNDLERRRLDLLEELALQNIDVAAAEKFLEKVPTAEALLPMPKAADVKELVA